MIQDIGGAFVRYNSTEIRVSIYGKVSGGKKKATAYYRALAKNSLLKFILVDFTK